MPQSRFSRGNGDKCLAIMPDAIASAWDTQLILIEHSAAICDSRVIAEKINQFLGGTFDVAKMVTAIDPTRGGALFPARPVRSY